jgi:hypothetical protein
VAWIKSHQSLAYHRKTLAAAELLHIDRCKMIGHLHMLWWWGLDNADSNGHLGRTTPQAIAEAASWPIREAERFVDALVNTGFLEVDQKQYALHDWYDYAGKLNDQRMKNRERMSVRRDQRTNGARAEHVQHTTSARVSHDRDTTDTRVTLEKSRVEKSREDQTITPPIVPPSSLKCTQCEHVFLPGEPTILLSRSQGLRLCMTCNKTFARSEAYLA